MMRSDLRAFDAATVKDELVLFVISFVLLCFFSNIDPLVGKERE